MQTMMRYQRNQQKPEMLREDMFHQVRNLAQPLVMVVPMLYNTHAHAREKSY